MRKSGTLVPARKPQRRQCERHCRTKKLGRGDARTKCNGRAAVEDERAAVLRRGQISLRGCFCQSPLTLTHFVVRTYHEQLRPTGASHMSTATAQLPPTLIKDRIMILRPVRPIP